MGKSTDQVGLSHRKRRGKRDRRVTGVRYFDQTDVLLGLRIVLVAAEPIMSRQS